jgi:hypothetical protein
MGCDRQILILCKNIRKLKQGVETQSIEHDVVETHDVHLRILGETWQNLDFHPETLLHHKILQEQ